MTKSAITVTALVVVFLVASLNNSNDVTLADPPKEKLRFPPDVSPPNSKVNPSSPEQRDKQINAIQAILEREGDVEPGEIPDDLRAFIQSQGSILDGSSLDPKNALPNADPTNVNADKIAQTAESLLRAARLLQQNAPNDKTRQNLVRAMRQEAAKLLLNAFPIEER